MPPLTLLRLREEARGTKSHSFFPLQAGGVCVIMGDRGGIHLFQQPAVPNGNCILFLLPGLEKNRLSENLNYQRHVTMCVLFLLRPPYLLNPWAWPWLMGETGHPELRKVMKIHSENSVFLFHLPHGTGNWTQATMLNQKASTGFLCKTYSLWFV